MGELLGRRERQRMVSNIAENLRSCKSLRGYSEVEDRLLEIEDKVELLRDYYMFEKIIGTNKVENLTKRSQIRFNDVKNINEVELCKDIFIMMEKLLRMKSNKDYYRNYVQSSKQLVLKLCNQFNFII